jgi:hypothetical protein
VTLAGVLAVALAIFLLLRTCQGPGPPDQPRPFDYFRDKAEQLGRDPQRAITFVRDEIQPLPYRGLVKGPLGALWEGAGSPEEKLGLARAILAHCDTQPEVTLDRVAPDRDRTQDSASPRVCRMRIVLVNESDRQATEETVLYDGAIADLVGMPQTLALSEEGHWLWGAGVFGQEIRQAPVGERSAQLRIEIDSPGSSTPTVSTRELYCAENTIGPRHPSPGSMANRDDAPTHPASAQGWPLGGL